MATIFSLITFAARAETIEITDDRGGFLFLYQKKWEKIALQHPECADCGRLPVRMHRAARLCAAQEHLRDGQGRSGLPSGDDGFATKQLLEAYPEDIKAWIDQHGGLTYQVMWMQAPETYHYFQKCP